MRKELFSLSGKGSEENSPARANSSNVSEVSLNVKRSARPRNTLHLHIHRGSLGAQTDSTAIDLWLLFFFFATRKNVGFRSNVRTRRNWFTIQQDIPAPTLALFALILPSRMIPAPGNFQD